MNRMLLQLITVLFLFSSCGKDGDSGTQQEKNIVKGRVTDGQGRPLKNVTIIIDNTIFYNTVIRGVTDDDGRYKITLTNGAWQAYAEMNVVLNGKTYRVHLHPDNSDGFSQDGAVRNFTWKLTGDKPAPMTGVYGGTVFINKALTSAIYDSEDIEFTLVSSGTLIDGSQGQTIKMKHGLPGSPTFGQLRDLPIGRYTITAVFQSPAGNIPLKLRNDRDPASVFSNSLQFDFEPLTNVGDNAAVIEYSEN